MHQSTATPPEDPEYLAGYRHGYGDGYIEALRWTQLQVSLAAKRDVPTDAQPRRRHG
jgi:hypothetical protein